MSVYLGVLLAWGAFEFGDFNILFKGAALALLYALFDVLWTYLRNRVWYWPLSSLISGFIIALIAIPSPPWFFVLLLPLVAVILKQLVKIGSRRHIFNPAAAAVGVFMLAGFNSVSWWGVAWGTSILYAVLLIGIYILWQIKRFETALSFLISYALFLAALFAYQGRELGSLFELLRAQIFDGTVIFFTSVMLIEHVTSNFPGRRNKIIYGILAAFFAFIFTVFGQYPLGLDPLISGLLFGNLIMSVVTLLL